MKNTLKGGSERPQHLSPVMQNKGMSPGSNILKPLKAPSATRKLSNHVGSERNGTNPLDS